MRHLGKVSIALLFVFGACDMYGARAPRPRNPVPTNPGLKGGGGEPPVVVVKDIEECEYHERAMPVPKPSPRTTEQEHTGDESVKIFAKSDDQKVKSNALIDAIDSYGRALAGDPFNPEITLKLALAYDKAQRKGCALALLGRLSKLSNNEKFAKRTQPVIDEVLDRKGYFERYRNAAIKAVGR